MNNLTRRTAMASAFVIGSSIGGAAAALTRTPSKIITPTSTRTKPTYVAEAETPFAHSLADNLFWGDIMMEHAMFFAFLMPGPDLTKPRQQAEEFQRLFGEQLKRAPGLTPDNYISFNRNMIGLVKRFSDYKKTMRELQISGKIRSLVWPLFFQHTAREADRFASRLELYNRKIVAYERNEVVDFWSATMGEHSGFISHLLDPDERTLIAKANEMEITFLNQQFAEVPGDDVLGAANSILEFKNAGEEGIYTGGIKSIIPPALASHVRREAERFIDELKRAK